MTTAERLPPSIATVCLSGTLPDKLEAAAAAGFDGVEIFQNDLLTFDATSPEVRRMCEELGLAITLFQPFRDSEAMPTVDLKLLHAKSGELTLEKDSCPARSAKPAC